MQIYFGEWVDLLFALCKLQVMEKTAFTVYGLRLKGEREVRYIGQTNGSPWVRLQGHLNTARRGLYNQELNEWLLANELSAEAFAIAKVDSRKEAEDYERAIIALCVRLDQRLLNRRKLPLAVSA